MSIGRDRRCQSNTAKWYPKWCEEVQASYCLNMLRIKNNKTGNAKFPASLTPLSATPRSIGVLLGAPVTIAALLLDLRSKNVWHGLGGVA